MSERNFRGTNSSQSASGVTELGLEMVGVTCRAETSNVQLCAPLSASVARRPYYLESPTKRDEGQTSENIFNFSIGRSVCGRPTLPTRYSGFGIWYRQV